MKVKTDHGVETEAIYMEGPTMTDRSVWLKMKNDAPLHEIARVFETAKSIVREETEQQYEKTFTGLTLVQIQRERGGTVLLQFATEE